MKIHSLSAYLTIVFAIALFHLPAQAASLGTWPALNVGKPAKLFVSGVAYGDGKWVAVGQGGYIAISTDGVKWTRKSAGFVRSW